MARKTKAELAAEREEARAAYEAHQFASYPTRLLSMLELASSLSYYELKVEESKFVVRNYSKREEFRLLPHSTYESEEVLQELEWVLKTEQAERDEAVRRMELKQAALSKLTKEERELLGL